MAEYYVVSDAKAAGAFVAGFGDPGLAVAYAASEAAAGRSLRVHVAGSGEQIFPEVGEEVSAASLRTSLLRLRRPLGLEDD